ncbi:hypothetical protein CA54_21980 [Symmachiella macrocystis]|uniref:Uncharacterized protein n=1 Tax=Symmachiella macrocystis TaxID=2527985 RepID=A0A5C6BMK5_9PLAN|nr:hypothetical protein [Symmachiella macrocystis]TWU13363.1 hypothetical protein CA54_21980 [Symmachiella macrocystis]
MIEIWSQHHVFIYDIHGLVENRPGIVAFIAPNVIPKPIRFQVNFQSNYAILAKMIVG